MEHAANSYERRSARRDLGNGSLLELRGLRVEGRSGAPIVEDVSFAVGGGEILGVVGESGAGKTTTALALFGYTQAGATITSGVLTISGEPVRLAERSVARTLRGRVLSYVPQSPATALNPSLRIGDIVEDRLRAHHSGRAADNDVQVWLERAGLSREQSILRRYPHQLSGGQQQRVCLAAAMACRPLVLVLDEPTTGLDVVTQASVIEELLRMRRENSSSMIYITHDLAVLAQVADRIAVMYAGRIVELAAAKDVLRRPRHPYTQGLLNSIPDHVRPRKPTPMQGSAVAVDERPRGCAFAPRCSLCTSECAEHIPLAEVAPKHLVRCVHTRRATASLRHSGQPLVRPSSTDGQAVLTVSQLTAEYRSGSRSVVAVDGVSLSVDAGECLALVGESGSGKTTIARTVAGLHPSAAGEIRLFGVPLAPAARRRSVEQRRSIQLIFQNPNGALNPRHSVRSAVARPARLLRSLTLVEADAEADRMLERVRISRRLFDRYPAELSGGERQRVSIARALAAKPHVIVCDEITSAVDVSVQATVLDLLSEMREELELALLFITHDLGVVASFADRVAVLADGIVREEGTVDAILRTPRSPYTRRLVAAAPSISLVVE